MCGAEYALRDGVAWLTSDGRVERPEAPGAPTDPMRVAALLGLGDPAARVMLCGEYGSAAAALESAMGVRCLVVNAPSGSAIDALSDHFVAENSRAIPLANGSLHGVAVDDAHATWLADVARVVRVGGRVVAPSHAPVPKGCRELARDDQEWVAEVEPAVSVSALTRLTRGRSTGT